MTKKQNHQRGWLAILIAGVCLSALVISPAGAITDEEYKKLIAESSWLAAADQEMNDVLRQLLAMAGPDQKQELEKVQKYWLEARDGKAKALAADKKVPLSAAYATLTSERSSELKPLLIRSWSQKLLAKKPPTGAASSQQAEIEVKPLNQEALTQLLPAKPQSGSGPTATEPDPKSSKTSSAGPETKTSETSADLFNRLALWPSGQYKPPK